MKGAAFLIQIRTDDRATQSRTHGPVTLPVAPCTPRFPGRLRVRGGIDRSLACQPAKPRLLRMTLCSMVGTGVLDATAHGPASFH